MTYEASMRALIYNALGGFPKECCQIYWENYAEQMLKTQLTNLHIKYA